MDIKEQYKKILLFYFERHITGTLLTSSLCSYESASDNFEGHSRRLPDKSYKLPPLGKSPFTLYTGTIPDMRKRNSASKLDFSSCPETQLWVYILVDYHALANKSYFSSSSVLKLIL
jgi:hypothetical protein